MRPPTPTWIPCWSHTLGRRVLAKVLGLVSAEDAGGLDRGSGTTGELLVEVDDALHAKGVRGSTNGLRPVSQQFFRSSVVLPVAILVLGPANNPSSRPSKAAAPDPSRRTRAARSPTNRRNSTEKTYLGGGDLGPTVSIIPTLPTVAQRPTLGGMSVESARRVTKLMLAKCVARSQIGREVDSEGNGQSPSCSVRGAGSIGAGGRRGS